MNDWTYDAELDGVQILATEELTDDEARAYRDRGKEKHGGLYAVHVKVDGEFVDLTYCYKERVVYRPFERIRRITGYLVGTLDRWNDGKRAEEADRVKHGV